MCVYLHAVSAHMGVCLYVCLCTHVHVSESEMKCIHLYACVHSHPRSQVRTPDLNGEIIHPWIHLQITVSVFPCYYRYLLFAAALKK